MESEKRRLHGLTAQDGEHQHVERPVLDPDAARGLPPGHRDRGSTDRRQFLRRAGVGTALAVGATVTGLPAGLPLAWAQDEPPSKYPDPDEKLLIFGQTLEKAFVNSYDAILPQITDPALSSDAESFRDHHVEHATALGETLRQTEKDVEAVPPNALLVNQVRARLSTVTDQRGAIQVLLDLEEGAAGFYLESIGKLVEAFYAQTMANIQPVESQHAAVWGYMLDAPGEQVLPAQAPTNGAFLPSDYGFVP